MLPIISHLYKRKAEILLQEGKAIVAKTPIIIHHSDSTGTQINIKTAAAFHGQISRDAAGEVDLVAEMQKHPEALWIRVKAIEADAPNDNGDYFSREEIVKSYKTFEGCPVFTNHENSKVENAKGKVIKADWDEREGAVYCTMFVDREACPSLCRAIEEGYVTDVSMGTQVDYSTCSICGQKALTADSYCDHIKTLKGRTVDGKKVFEKNYGLKFIEVSVVTDGACKSCTIQEVIDPNEYLTRLSKAVGLVKKAVASTGFIKDGGQAEIQKLNQAMDLLEDVSRTMLDQRQYIDLEFLNKVTEVLADLQHVNDELVDQGYGRINSDGGAAQPQQQMGIPPLPETTKQEQTPQVANPFTTGPTSVGVGTVTEPATASSEKEGVLRVAGKIKDLTERVTKIYEEAKQARLGGNNKTMDTEKANQTTVKLAKLWDSPSVKKFITEVEDGDFKVVVGSEEVIGVQKSTGKKIATLKVANLDADVQAELLENPTKSASILVDALKTSFVKSASYAPTDTKAQQEQTMEAQLREQKPPLHPRTDEVRESITEDQLRKKTEGYDNHARRDDARDAITEKQLKESEKGYEYHKRDEAPRDEITEKQLRNEKWKGNVTPAGKEGEWVAGVNDQSQQITEGQLEDWKKADKRHLPTDRITEKQLAEDSENWGRRIASREDALKAKTATLNAIAKTVVATGATPEEILSVVGDFMASPHNQIAAQKAVKSLSVGKETRQAMLNRSVFHGASKTASMSEIADYMLGSMADEGMSGEVALDTLGAIAEQKNAVKLITDAVSASKTEDKPAKIASGKDLLREALTDNADEISIILKRESVKADEKDEEKFAAAAFEVATKLAEAQGLKITQKVHVAKTTDGKIEVAMMGVKEAKKTVENKEEEKKEDKTLEARKETRKNIVAQMGGGMPGADPMGGGAMPGAGGGTTMPPPPAGAADPNAGIPPAAGLGTPPPTEEEEAETGEALPPLSTCPVCNTDNVDVRHGEWTCNDCGAAGDVEVLIRIKEYPGVIEDSEPEAKPEGEAEGGIGEMGGGAGMAMPEVGIAASFKLSPEMIKKAGNKPIGSYCPHCGCNKTKLSMKQGSGISKCESCKGAYRVDTFVDTSDKTIVAKIAWFDQRVTKLAMTQAKEKKLAKIAAKKEVEKKQALKEALAKTGLTVKFAKAKLDGKAEIIAELVDKKILSA